jgi:hypothetical protein
MAEETQQEVPEVAEATSQEQQPMSYDDGIIKVNLGELNKPQEDTAPEAEANASESVIEQDQEAPATVIQEEAPANVQVEESVLEEITEQIQSKQKN